MKMTCLKRFANWIGSQDKKQGHLQPRSVPTQCVPDWWALRVFRQFSWIEAGFIKMALSRPAHQRVTPADRRPIRYKSEGQVSEIQ